MSKNKTIIRLFEKAGDVGPTSNIIKIIKTKFNAMDFDEFKTLFMEALCSVFISESPMHYSVANNMIKFAAHSLSVLTENNSQDGRSGMYLLTEFFRLCLLRTQCKNKIIRWRFCLFLNYLLKCMSVGMALPVELCDVARTILLGRLKDVKAEVRVQAVHALHWLQSPDNHECEIVNKFIFHMTSDPCVEVRASIAKEIAMYNIVINEMLKYTLTDVNENVRKEAFYRFLEYPFDHLSLEQRQQIVEYGLKDSNKNIRSLIKKQLLIKWLENCNNDYEIFLKHMNIENVSVCEQIMNILFESIYDSQVLELTKKFLNSNHRLIDFNQLTMEKIFLWKCIGKYLTFEKKIKLANMEGCANDEYIEILLPDLVNFSDYIREYYFNYKTTDDKEFILIQLLDFATIFVMDDVGAASLNTLCYDLILDSKTNVKLIKPLTVLLNLTFEHGSDILNYTKQILNEIQTQIVDILPLINKLGTRMIMENQITVTTTRIHNILEIEPDSEELKILLIKLKKMKKKYNKINIILFDKTTLVEEAIKILLKSFELVYQVQQTTKVSNERSLVTDIIQNIIVDYLDCSLVSLRMDAIRALSPYLLANNLDVAKVHINILFHELSNPMANKYLMIQLLFELLLTYGLQSFDINDNIDADHDLDDDLTAENILSSLANSVDYEVDDSSFKLKIVEGFCNLMIFSKLESINVISKFLIIWFRRLTRETSKIYQTLMTFFIAYMFHSNSSSSTIAKCYVPIFKQISEHELTGKLTIDLNEMNTTLINLSEGVIYKDEKKAINAHNELAGYVLDYLLDKNQPYTTILVDTLFKLNINFECDNKLPNRLVPKIKRVIKYFKRMENDKNSMKYLKKIKQKFGPILKEKKSQMKKYDSNELNDMEIDDEQSECTSSINYTQEPSCSKTNFCSQENIEHASLISDDDDDEEEYEEQCRNLSTIIAYRRNFNMEKRNSSSDSE